MKAKIATSSVLYLSLSIILSGCLAQNSKKTSLDDLKQIIQNRANKDTLAQLAKDIDNPELQASLQKTQAEAAQSQTELTQAKRDNNTQKVRALQNRLNTLEQHIQHSIKSNYTELRIDFKDLNHWILPKDSKRFLQKNKSKLCGKSKHRILIYGYGGYLGGEKATKNVSKLRAQSIETWIKGNTNCQQMLVRGLGVHISASEIQNADISAKEKQSILKASRHARIFIRR